MANPPKPFDVLTLMFRCAELGGVDECVFRLVAGSKLCPEVTLYSVKTLGRSAWYYPECMIVYDNQGNRLRGKAAIQCIAEQRTSIQTVAQIIDVMPKSSHACQCTTHLNLRATQELSKLIGTHPSDEE